MTPRIIRIEVVLQDTVYQLPVGQDVDEANPNIQATAFELSSADAILDELGFWEVLMEGASETVTVKVYVDGSLVE